MRIETIDLLRPALHFALVVGAMGVLGYVADCVVRWRKRRDMARWSTRAHRAYLDAVARNTARDFEA